MCAYVACRKSFTRISCLSTYRRGFQKQRLNESNGYGNLIAALLSSIRMFAEKGLKTTVSVGKHLAKVPHSVSIRKSTPEKGLMSVGYVKSPSGKRPTSALEIHIHESPNKCEDCGK